MDQRRTQYKLKSQGIPCNAGKFKPLRNLSTLNLSRRKVTDVGNEKNSKCRRQYSLRARRTNNEDVFKFMNMLVTLGLTKLLKALDMPQTFIDVVQISHLSKK